MSRGSALRVDSIVGSLSLVSLVLSKELNKNVQGVKLLCVALRGILGGCSDATEASDAKSGPGDFQNCLFCQERTNSTEDMVSIVHAVCLTYIRTTSRRAEGTIRTT